MNFGRTGWQRVTYVSQGPFVLGPLVLVARGIEAIRAGERVSGVEGENLYATYNEEATADEEQSPEHLQT